MKELVNGRIPAYTRCPFREECPFANGRKPACHHQGVDHPVPFSCATARLFVIIKQDQPESVFNDPE